MYNIFIPITSIKWKPIVIYFIFKCFLLRSFDNTIVSLSQVHQKVTDIEWFLFWIQQYPACSLKEKSMLVTVGRIWEGECKGEGQRSEFERDWSSDSVFTGFCSPSYGDSFLSTVMVYGFILLYLNFPYIRL